MTSQKFPESLKSGELNMRETNRLMLVLRFQLDRMCDVEPASVNRLRIVYQRAGCIVVCPPKRLVRNDEPREDRSILHGAQRRRFGSASRTKS